jgi:hypothetical protein
MPNPTPGYNPNMGVQTQGLFPNGGAGQAAQTLANNGVTGPTPPQIGAVGGAPAMASQAQLMQALSMQASGAGGPTLAQGQLQQGLAGGLAASTALAAGDRGLQNPGVANKQLQTTLAGSNAAATSAAAATRATSQLTAQGALANVQAQAEQNAQAQAQLDQQAQLAYNAQVAGLTANNQQASDALFAQMVNLPGQMMSGGGQALATVGKSSDETAKKDIKDVSPEDMMNALGSHSYKYKNPSAPGAAPGKQHGVMAQELTKSEMGKSSVIKGPDGKLMVDTGRLSLALASAAGNLHQRIKKLEAKRN